MKLKTSVLFLAALTFPAAIAQAAEPAIRKGSTVTMHYTLVVDSKVVDSSAGKKPLTYVQGAGQIIPGLEEKVAGLKKGAKKHVVVSPEKGYGKINEQAFQNVPKSEFKDFKNIKIGQTIQGEFQGRPIQARVIGVEEDQVMLDLNHPLAGKTLNFDVEVVNVAEPRK